jgi:hypothetical protein
VDRVGVSGICKCDMSVVGRNVGRRCAAVSCDGSGVDRDGVSKYGTCERGANRVNGHVTGDRVDGSQCNWGVVDGRHARLHRMDGCGVFGRQGSGVHSIHIG